MRPRKTLLCILTLLAVVCGSGPIPWGPGAEAAMPMRVAYVWDNDDSPVRTVVIVPSFRKSDQEISMAVRIFSEVSRKFDERIWQKLRYLL